MQNRGRLKAASAPPQKDTPARGWRPFVNPNQKSLAEGIQSDGMIKSTSGVAAVLAGGGALPDCMLADSLATSSLTDAVRTMGPNRTPEGSSQNCSLCSRIVRKQVLEDCHVRFQGASLGRVTAANNSAYLERYFLKAERTQPRVPQP